jgi:DNA topoisomerase-3
MTDEAIKEGFAKLKDGNEYNNLYFSAKCRSESDWLVGINATRAYTTKNNVLLSIGRVQTPTLALIVDRQNEIDKFVPKDYFELVVDYGEFKGVWFDSKPSETKIDNEEKAREIQDKVTDKEGQVIKINKKQNKQLPPLLYDLTELQRDGNKSYGYTAQKVLSIAQNLYEKRKLITYPRTDSRYLSDDLKKQVKNTMKKINISPYNKAIEPILSKGDLKFNKRIINNKKITDHHAIIPTNVVPKINNISEEELNIYNLIVKRFIAVFYEPFLFETTEVIVEVEEENFSSKGKIIKQKGWKALYTGNKDDKDQILPPVKKGDKVTIISTEILKKKTSPPKPYTEATLLSAMENAGRFVEDEELKEQLKEAGFGTPATRAGIIERLIKVEYIYRKGKSLYPTSKGSKLIQIIPNELKSPETTGKWEKGLSKISKGELDSERFMSSIKRFVVYLVSSAGKSKGIVEFEQEAPKGNKPVKIKGKQFGDCPLCGKGKVLENTKAYYCSEWRNKCKMTIWKNELRRYGRDLDENVIKELLKDRKIEEFKIILPQTGEERLSTLTLTESGEVKLLNVKEIE